MADMTIQQAIELAIQHHQAGRLQQAESLCRQILAQVPDRPDALHLLGIIAHQVGRNDIAVDLLNQAARLAPQSLEYHANLGVILGSTGRTAEAITALRRALELSPDHAQVCSNLAHALQVSGQFDQAIALRQRLATLSPESGAAQFDLGNALWVAGKAEQAIAAYRQAVALEPRHVQAYCHLAHALQATGQLDQAVAAYQAAIALQPDNPELHNSLGSLLRSARRWTDAAAAFGRALAIRPGYAEAHNNIGNALCDQGRVDEAIAAYQQALRLKAAYPEAHSNLGAAMKKRGRLSEALAAYQNALRLKPDYAEAWSNLGNALEESGQVDEAISAQQKAVALKPDYAEAHFNLGNALHAKGQSDPAIAAFQRALELKPTLLDALSNLGNAMKDAGDLDQAIAAYRRAMALDATFVAAHDNLLLTLCYDPNCDAATLRQELERWDRQHAQPLRQATRPYGNDRDPDRRLRIGYVSPDFRDHAVGRNLMPLFTRHDHRQFEIFCYASVQRADALTDRFRHCADQWRNILGLSDNAAAELIRQDRIDILVDLALHTAGNRLLVLARRPAPLQMTFAGYPGSTGLKAIDYRLSDPYLDPPEDADADWCERTWRLPHSFWCFQPLEDRAEVNDLPALASGRVTFGCLGNFCKVNARVLRLWAKVLQAVPDSRLLLLAAEGAHRQRCIDLLQEEGIAPGRLEFTPRCSRAAYLELYHQIDVALDTLPYNGHTTSLDCLWMGVPVVTLVRQTIVGRAGLSQLMNLGLPEMIAHDEDSYVQIAAALAQDTARLRELRQTLRTRMQRSPLMDDIAFARGIEAAYRTAWRQWCLKT